MAELSNHSYHYNRNLLMSLPFDPTFDLFDSLLPDNSNEPELLPSPNEDDSLDNLDLGSSSSSTKEKKGNAQKKKPRRKRRNLTGVSKQRRAANERERKRLQIINSAFKDLKSILPLFPNENNISKIEIVRLAARTIQDLSQILNPNDDDIMENSRSPGGSESSDQSEGSSVSNDSNFPDFEDEAKMIDTKDIDISSLLFNYEDLSTIASVYLPPSILEPKKEKKRLSTRSSSTTSSATPSPLPKEEFHKRSNSSSTASSSTASPTSSSSSSSSSSSASSSSSSDGFSGFDFNIFLNESDSDNSKDNDVFPSMLSFW